MRASRADKSDLKLNSESLPINGEYSWQFGIVFGQDLKSTV